MQILNICIVLMLVTSAVIKAKEIREDGRYKLLKKNLSTGRYENVQGTERMSESLKKKIMMFFYGHDQKEPPTKGPTYIITIPNQLPTLTTPLSPTTSPTTSGTTSQTLTLTDPSTGLTPDLSPDPDQSTRRGFPIEEDNNDMLEDEDQVDLQLDDEVDEENESFGADNADETGGNITKAGGSMDNLQSADSGLQEGLDSRRQTDIKRLSELYQQQEMKQANRNRLGNAQSQKKVIKRRNRRNKQQQQTRRRKQQTKKRNNRKRLINQQNKPCRVLRKKINQKPKTNIYRVEI